MFDRAQSVHGNRQRLVGLGRDRAVAHGAAGEPLDDRVDRFDLLDRNWLDFVGTELEESPQGAEPLVLLVDHLRVFLEDVVAARLGGMLQAEDRLRVEQVVFPVASPLVLATFVQERRASFANRIGSLVVLQCFPRDLGQANAAHARRRLVEVAGDKLLGEADGLEDLGASVTLDGADAHLRHHLDDALLDGLAIPRDGVVVVNSLEQALTDHVVERLERHVGIDRSGAVAQKEGEVVHLAGVAALDEEPGPRPLPLADEVMVQPRTRQQRRDRGHIGAHAPVGEDDQAGPGVDRRAGLLEERLERAPPCPRRHQRR